VKQVDDITIAVVEILRVGISRLATHLLIER
jgi:hypothetical protein